MYSLERLDGGIHEPLTLQAQTFTTLGRLNCVSTSWPLGDGRVSKEAVLLTLTDDGVLTATCMARNPIFYSSAASIAAKDSNWIEIAGTGTGASEPPKDSIPILREGVPMRLNTGDMILLQPHRYFFRINRLAPPIPSVVLTENTIADFLLDDGGGGGGGGGGGSDNDSERTAKDESLTEEECKVDGAIISLPPPPPPPPIAAAIIIAEQATQIELQLVSSVIRHDETTQIEAIPASVHQQQKATSSSLLPVDPATHIIPLEEIHQNFPQENLPPILETAGDATAWLWCQAHGVSSLAELYALSDEASTFGFDRKELPVPCPWSYERIMTLAGHHLRLFPFLELAIRPEAEMCAARERLLTSSTGSGAGAGAGVQGAGAGTRRIESGADGGVAKITGATPTRKRRLSDDNPSQSSAYTMVIGAAAQSGAGINYNEHITKPLQILEKSYKYSQVDVEGASSGLAEKKRHMLECAIGVLIYLPFKVQRVEQIAGLPFCSGKETLDKIDEILRRGSLLRSDVLLADVRIQTLLTFGDVLWAGPVAAKRWYEKLNITSIAQLRVAAKEHGAVVANVRQRLGLELYDDLNIRIVRREADAVRAIIAAVVTDIIPGSLCILGGSFRRGQPSTGDVDLVIGVPAGFGASDLMPLLYRRLRSRGWLTHNLRISWARDGGKDELPIDDLRVPGQLSSHRDKVGDTAHTYFGIWRFNAPASLGAEEVSPGLRAALDKHSEAANTGIHRRIDILCFHSQQFALSMHAWTGNTIFNRALNIYANLLGKAEIATALQSREPGAIKNSFRSDFDIYSYFGLRYIPPYNRCLWGGFSEAGVRQRR